MSKNEGIVGLVRDLAHRMEAREATALEASTRLGGEYRTVAVAEAQVYGKLRQDLIGLLDRMTACADHGVTACQLCARRSVLGPWTAARAVLDRLWPGAVGAWLERSRQAGLREDDGYRPVWIDSGPRNSALWAVHPDGGDRYAWIVVPVPPVQPGQQLGWVCEWRRVVEYPIRGIPK